MAQEQQATAAPPGCFDNCRIYLVPSPTLLSRMISDLSKILRSNGAEICEPRRDGTIPIEKVTHIISSTIDFPQYTEAQAALLPVVNHDWITASVKRGKEAPTRPFTPDPRLIFRGVSMTSADLPVIDKETIAGAVIALGGVETSNVTRLTTHVCALDIGHPKVQAALHSNSRAKIVLPHWFDDCFKLGKRIAEGPYLHPNPEILTKGADEEVDIPEAGHLRGATDAAPEGLAPATDSVWASLTVFANKKVMMADDLFLTPKLKLRNTLAEIVERGGGKMVTSVDACDMYICKLRQGDDYVRASRLCKDVGNLAWLYHLIANNEWTSPLRRLLHYPVPASPIPGFEGKRISVSNYGGEARIYLENLIHACGAVFTKTMREDNTHLITARDNSEKCKAALDWNISMVNHIWLEESYAKCAYLPVVKKHQHFPPRTNLGEVIGLTPLDERAVRDRYYPDGKDDLPATARKKRKMMDLSRQNGHGAAAAEGLSSADIGRDFDVLHEEEREASSKRARGSGVFATPSRHVAAGKENDTPSALSTGGRSAKSKALSTIHLLKSDIALYEKEKKRSSKDGHAPWGGKRAADMIEREKTPRSSSPTQEETATADEKPRPAKRSRPLLPDVEMRIVLTGFERWIGDKHKEDQDRRKLRDMGIQIVQETGSFEYLAAPAVLRTVKFLVALARGPKVISCDFINQVLETGEIPPVKDFVLRHKESEKKFGIELTKTIARARANPGGLLRRVPVYCTYNIRNGFENYKSIAEANGAIFKVYRARSGTTIRPTTAEEDGGAPPEPVYLLTSNLPDERHMWPKFEEMARKGNMEPRIVVADWLLDVVLHQDMTFDEHFLVENFFA